MSGTTAMPEGITNPPIDELLQATDSKYALVIYAAKRALQINAYYSHWARACWSTSGRWSRTHVLEKPLSVALREINSGCSPPNPSRAELPVVISGHSLFRAHSRAGAVGWFLGVSGGIAAYKVCGLLRLLTGTGAPVRVVPTAAAHAFRGGEHLGRALRRPGSPPTSGRMRRVPPRPPRPNRRRWCSSPRHRRPAGAGRPRDGRRPTHRAAADRPLPVVMAPGHAQPRCGGTRPPRRTWPPWTSGGVLSSTRPSGRLTGPDDGPGRLPDRTKIAAVGPRVLAAGRTPATDLAGRHVVSPPWHAGTVDPVRYLGEPVLRPQGVALAGTRPGPGPRVTLVAAALEVPPPRGEVVTVQTALELPFGDGGLSCLPTSW